MDIKSTKFDILVLAGQSNAEGCGVGPVEQEFQPTESVWYLNAEKTVEVLDSGMKVTYHDKPLQFEIAQERKEGEGFIGDLSLTFAQEYVKNILQADRKVLIVRAAIGGTGFQKENWGIGKQLYVKLTEMVDYALSLNEENRVVGFLWHQGEHDAFEKNEPERFKKQLADQLADVRARYGDVPFIAGDFVNEWKSENLADCQPILQKIREVLEEAGNGAFVETADLLSNNQKTGNGDKIHFCRESLHILGRRYFAAYQPLLKK